MTAPTSYTPTPSYGNVTVHGKSVTVPITFRFDGNGAGSGTNYTVTFRQSGLGTSVSWWVSLTGSPAVNQSSTGPSVSVSLANGSYDYTVGAGRRPPTDQPFGSVVCGGSGLDDRGGV